MVRYLDLQKKEGNASIIQHVAVDLVQVQLYCMNLEAFAA
jgi:hypothetical protein